MRKSCSDCRRWRCSASFKCPPPRPPPGRRMASLPVFKQAIVECRQMYGGDRGKVVNQVKPIWVENCFKQKTGHFPFEFGIPLYPPGYD
jgi:hypothetical protein